MSLDEFLDYTSKRRKDAEEYLHNKKKFADECSENILSIYNTFYKDVEITNAESVENSLKLLGENVFGLFPAFTDHYKKTDKLTFGITPQNDWIKEIDTTDSISELKNKVAWGSFDNAEEYVEKLQNMRKKQLLRDQIYKEVHLSLKRIVYLYFSEITELPSKGFLELDFYLFNFAKQCVAVFNLDTDPNPCKSD